MSEKIYIIGHKSPDLDSVVAAISYANFKNSYENTNRYIPAVAGEVNKVTEFVLEKFGFKAPEILSSAQGKKLILVDHNEAAQSVDDRDKGEIVEVLDHHQIDFKHSQPIPFCIRPWGSTCSIIYKLYKNRNIDINKNLAGLILSAVLDDTVITKSPTCTEKDKEIIEELASLVEIDNWREYGMDLFKVKSSVKGLTVDEIIKKDFKDFDFTVGKFGIGQVETVDLSELKSRAEELLTELEKQRSANDYHSMILFLTDIIKEGSLFLIATSDKEKMETALGVKIESGQVYIDGIISRKKQVAPKLSEVFDK